MEEGKEISGTAVIEAKNASKWVNFDQRTAGENSHHHLVGES
jgi:hypothetical protein